MLADMSLKLEAGRSLTLAGRRRGVGRRATSPAGRRSGRGRAELVGGDEGPQVTRRRWMKSSTGRTADVEVEIERMFTIGGGTEIQFRQRLF